MCALTIRSLPDEPMRAVFATLHEGGHALYDQGLPRELHGTLLADAPSIGVHESQARLWENHVGRSARVLASITSRGSSARFPTRSPALDARGFHRAINVIAPALTASPPTRPPTTCTCSCATSSSSRCSTASSRAADLPGAWNERYRALSRRHATGRAHGCLQDVHWALGEFGYFPTYTIGNLYAAQLVDAYDASHDLDAELASGRPRARCARWLPSSSTRTARSCRRRRSSRHRRAVRLDVEPFFRRLERRVAELE